MGRSRRFAALGLSLLLLVPGVAAAPGPSDDADLGRLTQVMALVRENYAGDVEGGRLMDGAIRGVIEQLDPHSRYLEPAAFDELRSGTAGGYEGIGASVFVRNDRALVAAVAANGPAALAGLRAGDELVAVDGIPVAGLSADQVGRRLRGPAGSRIEMTLAGPAGSAGARRTFRLTRQEVHVSSVREALVLDGGVAYVRIDHFTERTADEFDRAIGTLGGAMPRGLVLDVRGNPGGVLSAAVRIAERFVPRGKLIVTTEGRHPSQDRLYFSGAPGSRLAMPVAVLVDGGSASAAEVLAGALQDWDLAVLVGARTFGKGSVQTILPLDGGGGLKLTTARYYTPSGRSIERVGEDAVEGGAFGAPDEAAARARSAIPSRDARDSAPSFVTASGRRLEGGGGIEPDVVVRALSTPELAEDLEREGYFVSYVPERGVTAGERLARFRAYVEAERGGATSREWNEAAAEITARLEREQARRDGGAEAAIRMALARDPAFLKARALLLSGESLAQLLHEVTPAESR